MKSELNANNRYNNISIILHWILGAALVAIFIFGNYMADLPFSPQRLKLFNWHKWAGIMILFLSLLLLLWRLTHPAPALPAKFELKAHQVTHIALYAMFFVVPLTGWAYTSAAGFPVVLFGLFPLPDLIGADKALATLIKPWHEISAFTLAGLVVLHILAALKHHFIDRDGLLQRMSFRT